LDLAAAIANVAPQYKYGFPFAVLAAANCLDFALRNFLPIGLAEG
jgi:hypothetical protein